jgi:Tfp pilus assembly PilM family ATPase/Tfp pilus assembly protein PilN
MVFYRLIRLTGLVTVTKNVTATNYLTQGAMMKCGGIYITDKLIRFACVGGNKGGLVTVTKNVTVTNPHEEIADSLKNFLKDNKITCDNFVLGLPRTEVTVKYLTLPTLNEAEIARMVEYELNNLFPYKTEDLVFDYAVIQKGPAENSQLMLVAALREAILPYISTFKLAGLSPDAITISTVSLFNQFREQNRPPANYFLIHFDDGFMEMLLVSNGLLVFNRGVEIGDAIGDSHKRRDSHRLECAAENRDKALGDSHRFGGEEILRSAVGLPQNDDNGNSQQSQRIGIKKEQELIKTVELTSTILRDKGNLIDTVILSGGGVDLKGFAKGLEAVLPYKVEINGACNVVDGLAAKNNGSTLKIDLLPRDFKLKKKKDKRHKALVYFGTLLLLNLSLVANIVFLDLKAKREYLFLLQSEIKNIDSPASDLQKKFLSGQMLRGYVSSNRQTLAVLSELYRIAPEKINLSVLDVSPRKDSGIMIVSGQAKDSETVLKFAGALKSSALIKKADVNYIKKTKSITEDMTVDFEIKAVF